MGGYEPRQDALGLREIERGESARRPLQVERRRRVAVGHPQPPDLVLYAFGAPAARIAERAEQAIQALGQPRRRMPPVAGDDQFERVCVHFSENPATRWRASPEERCGRSAAWLQDASLRLRVQALLRLPSGARLA